MRFSNSPWKTALIVVLVVALSAGAVFGLRAMFSEDKEDAKKEISLSYSVGSLTDAGKYEVDSESGIYNKEAFECQGLRVTPDFDADVTYEVFFYDEDGYFISKTDALDHVFTGEPLLAKYARIEITPVEDEVVSWYEVTKYASQLKVEVNVKQLEFENVLSYKTSSSANNMVLCDPLDLSSSSYLVLKFARGGMVYMTIKNASDTLLYDADLVVKERVLTVTNKLEGATLPYSTVVAGDTNCYVVIPVNTNMAKASVYLQISQLDNRISAYLI